MAPGRCVCGYTHTRLKMVRSHIVGCAVYGEAWRADPEGVLDPEAEYERWKAEDDDPASRLEAKQARMRATFDGLDEARDRQARRWALPPDPLDT